MRYWLMKTEPGEFSIRDLESRPQKTEPWDGVRNYQARNFMRDEMRVGDRILFYHSNAKPPGVVGTAVVASKGYPDFTAWDANSKHPDPKSTKENPIWYLVDVRFESKFPKMVSLSELKKEEALKNMRLLQKGNRLSVMPVTKAEFHHILKMAEF